MGILLFFVIFGVVVIAHEFGHFIIAKANGIHVVEFSIGMGPCLCSFTKGGTKYAIRLLPIGGACMFEGEDGLNNASDENKENKDHIEKADIHKTEGESLQNSELISNVELNPNEKSGAFPDASVWARIATVVAGPVFNFILAFLLSLIIVGSYGTDMPIIADVMENGAAEQAGLLKGDQIVSLNNEKIHLYREVSLFSMLHKDSSAPVTIEYLRDGKVESAVINPLYDEDTARYYLGFLGVGEYQKKGVWGTIQYSGYEVSYWIKTTFKSLEMLIQRKVSKDDVAGPVGMAQTVNTIYQESKPDGIYYIWLNMLNFAILLSANLGVLNLLPFPALDGGRLVFLIIEAIRRKPVPPEKEGMVHFAGMVCLMILMVFVLYNDITKLF